MGCSFFRFPSDVKTSCSPQSPLTQSLTVSNFYPLNCSILHTKNYIKNSQTTYVHLHGTIETGPENNYFLTLNKLMTLIIFFNLEVQWGFSDGRDLPAL